MIYLAGFLLSMTTVSWCYWLWIGFTTRGGFQDPPTQPLLWSILFLEVRHIVAAA